MLELLPHIQGVLLTDCVICQRIKEWYLASRQWLMGLLSGVSLDINTLKIGFLVVVGLLLLLIVIQGLSYRSRRKSWLAFKPLIDGAVEAASEPILMVSPEGDIRYANPAAEAFFSLHDEDADVPDNLLDIVSRKADIKQEVVIRLWDTTVSRMQHTTQPNDFGQDFLFGEKLYKGRVTPVMDEKIDGIEALVVFFSVIEQSVIEDNEDPLSDMATGLLNYPGFIAELAARLPMANAGATPLGCALLYVENLDMLTLEKGFEIRDTLIGQLAQRITATLPEEWAVGRVADNCFALASPLERTKDESAAAVDKVARVLGQHLIWESQYVAPLIRTGIAYSDTADSALTLLDEALAISAALPQAPAPSVPSTPPAPEVKPVIEPFAPPVMDDTPQLEPQTVALYYQPQVYLKDGYLRGFHVNAVYESSPFGRLEGDTLYERIGEKGLIAPFMKALLVKALLAARQWHALYAKRLIIMCTLPPDWLKEPKLPGAVQEALEESSLAAEYLEFFIPYTKQHPWSADDRDTIEELKELGVRMAASGLVSGALPIAAAVSPPYNTLVMIRSLIAHAGESEKYRSLLSNIVQLGGKTGKDILALGIDGHNDLRILRQKECPYGQGLLIGGPVAEDGLAQILIDGIDLPS